MHYLRLIGADTSKYEKNKFEERRSRNIDGTDGENSTEKNDENSLENNAEVVIEAKDE